MRNNKILVIVGGPEHKVDSFREEAKTLNINLEIASFYDLSYDTTGTKYVLRVKERDLKEFGLVYIRVVGKRLEEATLLVNYLKKSSVKIVDRVYNESILLPSTISKAFEMVKLKNADIPIPPTYFSSLANIRQKAGKILGFPFVIKSTSGKKARDVWAPETDRELSELIGSLRKREIQGDSFFAQKLIKSSKRSRILVVDGKAIAGVARSTKFRKRFQEKVGGEYPEKLKETIYPVPDLLAKLSVDAAAAAGLDISGIDILHEEDTEELYVIEANAAPPWKLIKENTIVNVEAEILRFLQKRLNES